MEKEVPSCPFLTHPAPGPETTVFFSLAFDLMFQERFHVACMNYTCT